MNVMFEDEKGGNVARVSNPCGGRAKGRPVEFPRTQHGLKARATAARLLRAMAASVIASAFATAAVHAASRDVPTEPATKESSPIPGLFTQQAAQIENEIAADLEQRGDGAAGEVSAQDLRIDVRLVERWLARCAADAPADDPIQICADLRIGELQSLESALVKRLETARAPLSATQLEGLKRLHDFTFKLPELKDVAAMDAACQAIATDLILAGGPTQADTKDLPAMRPRPHEGPASRPAQSVQKPVTDLATQVRDLKASPGLHRQLLALAGAAAAAASDPRQSAEAAALNDALKEAIELLQGLENAPGFDPMSRPHIEEQIAQALALFNDVRTRAAGKARLAALEEYRQSFARLQGMKLPPELQQKLDPAFAWIRQNPTKGQKVQEIIQRYLALCAQVDASQAEASGLSPSQRRVVESMQKQIASHRQGFLDDAAELGGSGLTASTPANLEAHLDQMRRGLDSIRAIEQLPHAIQVLVAFRPRPFGGLERRATLAANDLGLPPSSERHIQAARFVAEVDHLSKIAQATELLTREISPAVIKAYAGDRLEAVQVRRNGLIAELAGQIAQGRSPDRAQIGKLEALRDMYDALRQAGSVDAAISRAAALSRWVDWTVSPDRLSTLLKQYQDATVAAFEGFAVENSTPVSRWSALRADYQPRLKLIARASGYADACAALPSGYFADCAKLMTPMDNEPFAAERYASFAIDLWGRCIDDNDAADADAIFAEFSQHLIQEEKGK